MTQKCLDCGMTTEAEWPGKHGQPTCTSCGSDDLEEAHACEICGGIHTATAYVNWSNLADDGLHICQGCRIPILKKFNDWRTSLTDAERKVLADAYDDRGAF